MSARLACGCDMLDLLCPHSASMCALGREGAHVGEVIAAERENAGLPPIEIGSAEWQRRAMDLLCGGEEAARLRGLSEAELEAELEAE